MFTVLSRIIHFGIKNFWRNGWLSIATVAVMILALLVTIGLILFNVMMDHALLSIQDKIDIAVYFHAQAPEDEILSIQQSLEKLEEVKNVDYISRDKALEMFRENHKDDPTITQALNELEENPLEASLRIKAYRPDDYESIAEFLASPSLSNAIDEISYFKNEDVIDRLSAIIDNVNRGGFVITAIMVLVAGLVVFNTIWIAIYSNRDEMGIMRAVGASNILVRGPFMVEGIIAGILGATLSIILALPFVHFASPFLARLIPEFTLVGYFYSHIVRLFLYEVIFGVLIGALSSFLAVRRYLKN